MALLQTLMLFREMYLFINILYFLTFYAPFQFSFQSLRQKILPERDGLYRKLDVLSFNRLHVYKTWAWKVI